MTFIGSDTVIILIIWLFTVALAYEVEDVFMFAIASFLSEIFGIVLVSLYIGDSTNGWWTGILGFILIIFGMYLLVVPVDIMTRIKKESKK